MSRFNSGTVRAPQRSAVQSTGIKQVNHNGAQGFKRDAKSELFVSAATSFAVDKFYESASNLRTRQTALLKEVAVADPKWTRDFLHWLRHDAMLRTGPAILACEAVKARLDAGEQGGNREIIRAVLARPDEPGELLAYWISEHGRRIPKPVKRGVADAVSKMYTERNWLKYDSQKSALRFADVIELTHPDMDGVLAKYILDDRHHEANVVQGTLPMIRANRWIRGVDASLIRNWAKNGTLSDHLKNAGMTWEDIPSIVNGPWTGELWDAIIPSMGAFALMRNLRNFDTNGISPESVAIVKAKLSDPDEIAKSRALPMRFLTAYKNAPNVRWHEPLEIGLHHTLQNVPSLKGRTLILMDWSGSMFGYSETITNAEKATLFGTALAQRAEHADLVAYGNNAYRIELKPGASLINAVESARNLGGTDTAGTLQAWFKGHDRVVIITDEQYGGASLFGVRIADPGSVIPNTTPLITVNLGGYATAQASGKNRVTIASLSDSAFKLIDLLGNTSEKWPWEA
ncbi:TROVE domain-containing protein [Tsukamurella soli]|uniref:TROVE domain-containing protein n=1 Tax=Tsukamurella soli TaxID=644556 RepID=A0ABP8JJ63_9ACTN